jgi:hypothetical protein
MGSGPDLSSLVWVPSLSLSAIKLGCGFAAPRIPR